MELGQGEETDLEIIGAGRQKLIAYVQCLGPVYTTKVLLTSAHTP